MPNKRGAEMLTTAVLDPLAVFKRGMERFRMEPASLHPEAMAASSGEHRIDPAEARGLLVQLVLLVALFAAAFWLSRGCKDKALNYAVILADPIAYIIARALFGRC